MVAKNVARVVIVLLTNWAVACSTNAIIGDAPGSGGFTFSGGPPDASFDSGGTVPNPLGGSSGDDGAADDAGSADVCDAVCPVPLTPCGSDGAPKPNNECCPVCKCVGLCLIPLTDCEPGESPAPNGECCPVCLTQ